ncbi:MAG: hypothetical protein U5K81_06850 [Trueperaceae bacterium]|nr:hypothetical protein [Trueperaceae bacterium]
MRVELGGTTSLTPEPLATLRAEAGGTRIALEADPRGLWLQGRARHPLGGGAWLDAFSDTRLRDGDERRLRAGLTSGIDPETRLPLGTGGELRVQGALRAGAEIAAEPDRDVAGPRLPFRAEARLRTPLTSWARADLRLTGTATAYPGMTPGGRAALDVAPSLRLEGPLGPASGRLVLGARRRVTIGDGPFEFDDVSARARLRADGRLRAGPLTLQARGVRRLAPETPGWEALSGRATAELALGADWTLRPALRAELAGLAGGPSGEDWLQAGATAEGPIAGHASSFGLQVRSGARDLTLRRVRASAATGFEVSMPGGSVVLEPSLSVDVAPLLRGAGGPALHAHGLRVTVNDCCGGWMLGYEREDGETRLAFGVTLPPLQLDRPPQPSLPTIPPLPSLEPSPDPSPQPGDSGAAPGEPGPALAGASGRAEGRDAR